MKNAATFLALLGVMALPACTVNYYGVGPGGPRRGNHYDYRDSTSTTVITQSGTVGLPPGSGNGNGGVRPPVRNGGSNGGSPQPTYGGVRGPGRTGSTAASTPPVKSPVYVVGGIKSPAPATAPVKDPVYIAGGIKGPYTPPTKADPAPVRHGGSIGGVRAEPADEEPVKDPLYGTGGIKGPHPVIKTDPALATGGGIGGVRSEPAADEQPVKDPLYGTGGIKGPHPVVKNEPAPTGSIGGVRSEPAADEQPIMGGPGKDDEMGNKPAFVFTKSSCLGPCPSYTATVWADGRVRYNGQLNVPRIGTFNLRMAPATVALLLQQAKGVGFTELRDHYASGATDIPATTLTIYQANGRSKTVVVEDNAPEEVNALFGNVAAAVSSVAGGNAENRADEK